MNRKISVCAFFIFSLVASFKGIAQETKEETLFGDISGDSIGFLISPSFLFTSMDEKSVAIFEIKGGVLFNKKFSVGPYYEFSLNEFVPISETTPDIYMDYRSIGGFVEYTIASNRLIHATFPVKIGYGEVEMDNEDGDINLGESNFLVIEPAALLEVNLHKYVKFNLGLGYRLLGEMTYRNLNQSDISGIVIRTGLRIGLF
jgi:hypothetical protein